jgi:hypothetical protein
VRHRLLDVLQRLAGEDRPRRIGVEEARRDADLDALPSSHRLREQPLEVAPVTGCGLVWWQMSATAISTRRGIDSRLTPTADRLGAMPIVCLLSHQSTSVSPASSVPSRSNSASRGAPGLGASALKPSAGARRAAG